MSVIKKIQSKWPGIKREYSQKKHFFPKPVAFAYSIVFYLGDFAALKHKAIIRILKDSIGETVKKYKSVVNTESAPIPDDCPIWIMWWQGEDKMPPIVKCCYNSVLRNKGKHPVYLLSENSYRQYIEIPPPSFKSA